MLVERALETKKRGAWHGVAKAKKAQTEADAKIKANAELVLNIQDNSTAQLVTSQAVTSRLHLGCLFAKLSHLPSRKVGSATKVAHLTTGHIMTSLARPCVALPSRWVMIVVTEGHVLQGRPRAACPWPQAYAMPNDSGL
jgi:hypothetical protein